MRVVDYFAGLGGFTLGATMAGATVVQAIDHWPRAVETHRANHPEVVTRCEDLTRRPRAFITAVLGKRAPSVPTPRAAEPCSVASVLDFDAGTWSPVERPGRSPATLARVASGRARFGRRFVMPYNGSGSGLTGRDIGRPIGTITAADRWAVVDGDRMRMLRLEEIRACMGFPEHYQFPATRADATQMFGNAVVPAVAASGVRAVMEAA